METVEQTVTLLSTNLLVAKYFHSEFYSLIISCESYVKKYNDEKRSKRDNNDDGV